MLLMVVRFDFSHRAFEQRVCDINTIQRRHFPLIAFQTFRLRYQLALALVRSTTSWIALIESAQRSWPLWACSLTCSISFEASITSRRFCFSSCLLRGL